MKMKEKIAKCSRRKTGVREGENITSVISLVEPITSAWRFIADQVNLVYTR